MAKSKCPSCYNSSFEIKEAEVSGSKYNHYFIQCESCGVVVGVIPYTDITVLFQQMTRKLRKNDK